MKRLLALLLLCSAPALAQSVPVMKAALSTTVQTIKAGRGVLHSYACANTNAGTTFVQVFDTTGAVTLGTTTPKAILPVRVGTDGGVIDASFVNGIKLAATTTATGNTAPATGLDCTFTFQ